MIYSMNDKVLLKYFRGIARIRLVLRLTYIKYVAKLGSRTRSSLVGKQSYEVLELKDNMKMEMFSEGVPWAIIKKALVL